MIGHGTRYVVRGNGSITLTVPLRDRNGEPIAALCVTMKSFAGQTDDNAVARALPVIKKIQARVQSLEDLLQ